MGADFEAFLNADDLDLLATARDGLTTITRAEADELIRLAEAADREPAFSNLLMYPEMLPEDRRNATLAAALAGELGPARVMAVVIGLGSWMVDDEVGAEFARGLLARVVEPAGGRALPMRASLTLSSYAQFLSADEVVGALAVDDEGVRQNVLAAMLRAWGPEATRAAVESAAESGVLPESVAVAVTGRLDGGGLVLPLAALIPPRDEWATLAAGG